MLCTATSFKGIGCSTQTRATFTCEDDHSPTTGWPWSPDLSRVLVL